MHKDFPSIISYGKEINAICFWDSWGCNHIWDTGRCRSSDVTESRAAARRDVRPHDSDVVSSIIWFSLSCYCALTSKLLVSSGGITLYVSEEQLLWTMRLAVFSLKIHRRKSYSDHILVIQIYIFWNKYSFIRVNSFTYQIKRIDTKGRAKGK